MTTNTIYTEISNLFANSAMGRKSKANFLIVPMGENEDGVMTYAKVAVSALQVKDTKTTAAFDFDAAVAEYAEWLSAQQEKASKPKKTKEADPAKEAEKQARQTALLDYMKANEGVEMTATEILDSLPEVYEGKQVMTVGSDLIALSKVEEGLTFETKEGKKKYWVYNA